MLFMYVRISMIIMIFFSGVIFAYKKEPADYEKGVRYNYESKNNRCERSLMSRCLDKRKGCFLRADLLVWSAHSHGYIVAFEKVSPLILPENDMYPFKGKLRDIDEHWSPGVRVGLGWDTNYDNWDVSANWTWYYNKSAEHIVAKDFQEKDFEGPQTGLIPLFVFQQFDLSLRRVQAGWRLNYNMIDVEIGKRYCVGSSLSLHPHLGLRSGWLYQTFATNFKESHTLVFFAPVHLNLYGKSSYWGIGPRLGVDGDWHLKRGFKMLGKISGALLYGRVNQDFQSCFKGLEGQDVGEWVKIADQQYKSDDIVCTLQLALGTGWGSFFNGERIYFATDLMWEVNYWGNQSSFPCQLNLRGKRRFPLVSFDRKNYLSLQGVTLNFNLHF